MRTVFAMHELSLMDSVFDLIAPKVRDPGKLVAVYVTVGPLSGVCADSLLFGFDLLAEERGFDHAKLVVERTSALVWCEACGREYESGDLSQGCPSCGALRRMVLSGDEFTVDGIEMEV
ncbi:MAG: hypothetical protein GF344_04400 [Chitinivibrionales bacterium]|nr:hypothetical protein [Chitinivibrionales bacterium]MBD3356284.1 hypothetical protein [Chitinivibrionales bacterium]